MLNAKEQLAIRRGRAAGRMLATGAVSQVAGHGPASDALEAAVAEFSSEPSKSAGYFAVGMISELNVLLMAVLENVEPPDGQLLEDFWAILLAKLAVAHQETDEPN